MITVLWLLTELLYSWEYTLGVKGYDVSNLFSSDTEKKNTYMWQLGQNLKRLGPCKSRPEWPLEQVQGTCCPQELYGPY